MKSLNTRKGASASLRSATFWEKSARPLGDGEARVLTTPPLVLVSRLWSTAWRGSRRVCRRGELWHSQVRHTDVERMLACRVRSDEDGVRPTPIVMRSIRWLRLRARERAVPSAGLRATETICW